MQEAQGKNNAQSLFGVHQIPTDNPIRALLDGVEPSGVYPMFASLFQGLHQKGVADRYRALGNTLALALDGTRYFSAQEDPVRMLFDAIACQWPGDLFSLGSAARVGQAGSRQGDPLSTGIVNIRPTHARNSTGE